MKLKVVVCLLAFVWLFGAAAQAQDVSKFDVFAGYSYVRANPATSGIDSFSMNGGGASLAYNANNWLSAVADFGGYHTNNILGTGIDGTLSTYLFGPRISYRHDSRITPFGQVLFGVASVAITDWHFPLRIILLPWRSEAAWTSRSPTVFRFAQCRWTT